MRRLVHAAGSLPLLLLTLVRPASAVSISPIALYIDSRTRVGTLNLWNDGTRPEEIDIAFAYGYVVSDSLGNWQVPLIRNPDSIPPAEPSAVAWLRAFPRRFVLQPGQRQIVRVLVRPPANLPEGEYWARVIVRSRGGQPPIEGEQQGVRFSIEVAIENVIALSYRHGRVWTSVDLAGVQTRMRGDTLRVLVDLTRGGNAAFIGRVLAEVLDPRGRILARQEVPVSVYRSPFRTRVDFPLGIDARGAARLRIRVDNNRTDIPPEGPLPVAAVVREIALTPSAQGP